MFVEEGFLMEYDREKAVAYAHEWAFRRNPRYYNFDGIGGDCTNYVSQCLYAGCPLMNYTPDLGWFYSSPQKRSAAWSGVPYLYNFLTRRKGRGPYGELRPVTDAQPGDIVQLSFDGVKWSHSLIVTQIGAQPQPDNVLLATHTYDADSRPLNSYIFEKSRLIHILGGREQ